MDLTIKKQETKKNSIKQRQCMKDGIIPPNVGASIFIGSIGSGKSTLIINLLKEEHFYGHSTELSSKPKPYFDKIKVLTGSDDDLYETLIKMKILKKTDIKIMPEESDIQKIIDSQTQDVKKNGVENAKKCLIVLDDLVDNAKLMRSQALKSLFIKPRQMNVCVFFSAQYLNLIPRSLRMQARCIFFFRSNRGDFETLADQYTPCTMKKKDFLKLIHQATEDRGDETHNFLFINRMMPLEKRFRRNLNKIIKIPTSADFVS